MRPSVHLFFNFRSPYCYLTSKTIFEVLAAYEVTLDWRPLGGMDGRSAADRAKVKVPLARQDMARWTRRMGIPFVPPPPQSDGTAAAAVSLLAERRGCLAAFVKEVMAREWGQGQDIGERELLVEVGETLQLGRAEVLEAADSPDAHKTLRDNWDFARSLGLIGTPSFVIDDAIFWGNDRIDFLEEHLRDLRLRKY